MNTTVEQRHLSVTIQPACHVEALAASLSNDHPHFKSLWSVRVNQQFPSPVEASQATERTSAGMRCDRPTEKGEHNWGNEEGQIVCAQWTDQNVHGPLSKSFVAIFVSKFLSGNYWEVDRIEQSQ